MKANELILLTLLYSKEEMIAGRTLLQKTLYFLNEKLKSDIQFAPHYYGPYSAEISDAIGSLVSAGILEESVECFPPFGFGITFEPRRYTYKLTDMGKRVAELVEKQREPEAKAARSILDKMSQLGAADDYRSLSVAAKMCHILKSKGKGMVASQILEEAKVLDWKINQNDAEAAIAFLTEMGLLVEVQGSEAKG